MHAPDFTHVSREGRPLVKQCDAELAALRRLLLRHARLLVADRDTAEDLVQETLIAVFRGQSSCRGDATLSTWAVGILRHKAADWYRSPARRTDPHSHPRFPEPGAEPGDACDDAEDGAMDDGRPAFFTRPDAALEQRELGLALEACIGRLPARSRQVFTMRERLGFDTDEVCDRLGISQDHCRTLLHRARTALRGHLLEMSVAP
jgi:RNA polymerase sigma-70 factor (ECF subfamily)